jgi:hypothetical protein
MDLNENLEHGCRRLQPIGNEADKASVGLDSGDQDRGKRRWREQLRRLEALDLPLLAVGGGSDGKAPANLRNGRALAGWETAKHTVQQISNACPGVIGCGTRTGKPANGLIAFDIDGATAVSWCLEHGCDPAETQTWQIHRNTDESRLKVVFRLTEGQQQQLGQLRTKVETKAAIKDAKGKTIEPGEAVELFHQGGSQVIVLGQHRKSKGHYFWPDGMGPEALATIPECWWQAAQLIAGATSTTKVKPASAATKGRWRNLYPCPICGRDNGYCQESTDETAVIRCFNGQTYSPPTGLKRGELHTDMQGTVWAFTKVQTQSDGNEFSIFVAPKPEESRSNRSKLGTTTKAAAAKPQNETAKTISKSIRLTPAQVMQRLPEEVGVLRLNTRSQDITAGGVVMTGNAIARLYLRLSSSAESWPKEATYDAAVLLAEQNSFDPVADELNGNTAPPLPMEQWQRLDRHLLGIDDPIAAAFLPRYLIAAVARTFDPGCDFRQTPVLVGPQWIGKTALGRILFGSQHFISGVGDLGKDSLERCHTAWGIELAELDGITRRSDQEALKAFLSETCDSWRSPYDKATERRPRRFLFWGTSNGAALRDTTGNTRFVCIPVEQHLPLQWAEQNRAAIWNRAVQQYRAGVIWQECSAAERAAIADRNDNYQEQDPWLPVVQQHLEHSAAEQRLPVQVPELLTRIGVPRERQGTREAKRVQQLAESLGWQQDRRQVGGKRQKGLWPSATPVAHQCHTSGTPLNTSQANGSDPAATPATPKPKELGEEREQEQEQEQEPPCVGTYGRVGVAGVAFPPNANQCNGSGGVARGGSGVAGVAGGVAAATIPGFVDPTPAPAVGSGADVMDDGDDPAWAKRQEAA